MIVALVVCGTIKLTRGRVHSVGRKIGLGGYVKNVRASNKSRVPRLKIQIHIKTTVTSYSFIPLRRPLQGHCADEESGLAYWGEQCDADCLDLVTEQGMLLAEWYITGVSGAIIRQNLDLNLGMACTRRIKV